MHEEPLAPLRWRLNALLFALTVLTTFAAGVVNATNTAEAPRLFIEEVTLRAGLDPAWVYYLPVTLYGLTSPLRWGELFGYGLPFAGTLLTILLFHEFGHYLFARRHRVEASLPFFIPIPFFFIGTMGAVIGMTPRIRSRNQLLDIGAAGPLAGLAVALPALVWGLAHSPVEALPETGSYTQEGVSLLYFAAKRLVHGEIPAGMDVMLHPVAFAAWVGLFMTALNLLPIGQLDGGHITFALLSRRHALISRLMHGALFLSLPILFLLQLGAAPSWPVFGLLIWVLMRDFGPRHPPVMDEAVPLSPGRAAIAVLCLALFVLLIPPVPLAEVQR